ncbi:hypothetical protein TNCV_3108651 [Trichonephila clavipes]|uniref:Uncharacterized protein n=1 Tax=Trichonephila clavipes TaxID=2585209 RepID=A0A8X6SCZ3_TRICX|nr:hypothetical protein TNCV_3108651 [Trichonephila clavipes]
MTDRRKGLFPAEIVNLLREISENESAGGEASCSNLDSDEDIRFSENDCEESEESVDIIDNILVTSDIYIYMARVDTERISHDSTAPGKFAIRNVLQQSSDPTSFAKHNVNVSFL